jgi:hypothetical protein
MKIKINDFEKQILKKRLLKSLITFLNNWACLLYSFNGGKTVRIPTIYLKNKLFRWWSSGKSLGPRGLLSL